MDITAYQHHTEVSARHALLRGVDLPIEEIRQVLAADHKVEVSRELVSS